MAIQNDNTLVTKGDLKALYSDKIAPYLGANLAIRTNVSDYYSADEKIIGIWIDGRPLYQKTITTTIPTSSTSTVKNVESTNGLKVYNIQAVIVTSGGAVFSNEYIDLGTTVGVLIWNRETSDGNNYICIKNTNSNRNGDTAYITIKYTKTTDAANSAVTTPGCYDLNFPNTWPENKEIYFGNGLYGYRAVGTTSVTADTLTAIKLNVMLRNIISSGGYGTYNSTGDYMALNYQQGDERYSLSLYGHVTDGLYISYKVAIAHNAHYDIWVTYTK